MLLRSSGQAALRTYQRHRRNAKGGGQQNLRLGASWARSSLKGLLPCDCRLSRHAMVVC